MAIDLLGPCPPPFWGADIGSSRQQSSLPETGRKGTEKYPKNMLWHSLWVVVGKMGENAIKPLKCKQIPRNSASSAH